MEGIALSAASHNSLAGTLTISNPSSDDVKHTILHFTAVVNNLRLFWRILLQ